MKKSRRQVTITSFRWGRSFQKKCFLSAGSFLGIGQPGNRRSNTTSDPPMTFITDSLTMSPVSQAGPDRRDWLVRRLGFARGRS